MTGPGTHITRPVEPLCPPCGVEGAAAEGRLDHHRAVGEGGDQPVAGQEPRPGGADPGGAPRPPRTGSEVVEQGTVLRGVDAVHPAGQHGHRGAAGRPARRGGRPQSMPSAAPETTAHAGARRWSHDRAGHPDAVGRGRRGSRPRRPSRRARTRGIGPLTHRPSGVPADALHGDPRRRGRRAWSATRGRPGTTKRMPHRGGLLELADRVDSASRWPALRRAWLGRGCASQRALARPSAATSDDVVPSPGSTAQLSTTRARRSSSVPAGPCGARGPAGAASHEALEPCSPAAPGAVVGAQCERDLGLALPGLARPRSPRPSMPAAARGSARGG